jgi:two-component system response regulator TrcR
MLDRRATLLQFWDGNTFFTARSMGVYIFKLRKHLRLDPDVEVLNIRGIGYKLVE